MQEGNFFSIRRKLCSKAGNRYPQPWNRHSQRWNKRSQAMNKLSLFLLKTATNDIQQFIGNGLLTTLVVLFRQILYQLVCIIRC